MKTADQMVIDGIEQTKGSLRQAVKTLDARGEKLAAIAALGALDSLDRCLTELRISAQLRRPAVDRVNEALTELDREQIARSA